jgi:calcineurin-like phosphoesterase family protein
MATYFYSDPHYGHANIIEFCGRPFPNVDEMNCELARLYRLVVRPDDLVIWCGDCFWTRFDGRALLATLPGRKWLVLGNHDRGPKAMAAMGFERVERELRLDGGLLVSHYPPVPGQSDREHLEGDRLPKPKSGEVVVHGHTHERIRWAKGRVHVGVDAWSYCPVPEADVRALAALG